MKYFAYGSNMLEERLQYRVPAATFDSTVKVQGYTLQFHKESRDGSAKCNIVKTDSIEDVIYGVIFDVPDNQLDLARLNDAEGLGQGYNHYNFSVQLDDGTNMPVLAYVADPSAINNNLIPYSWYHSLVVAGAEQHKLPKEYIDELRNVNSSQDAITDRPTKLEAEAALAAYNKNKQ